LLFCIGCVFAWFSWTQIARTKVFHQLPYTPPLGWVAVAVAAIALLIFVAMRLPPKPSVPGIKPPQLWLLGLLGAIWAVLWYGLVVLAFGLDPTFPEARAGAGGLAITALLLIFVPRWAVHLGWSRNHDYALVAGCLIGSMTISFVGFIGSVNADLWFKIIVDLLAVLGLAWLGRRALRRS